MISDKRKALSSKLEELKLKRINSDDNNWLSSILVGCNCKLIDFKVNIDIQQRMMNFLVSSEDVVSEIRVEGSEAEEAFVNWAVQNLCLDSEVFVAFELPSFRYCDWVKLEGNEFRRAISNLFNQNGSLKFLVKQNNDAIYCFTDTETTVQLVKLK